MTAKRLKEFLDGQHVKYVRMLHSPAYTSSEVAQAVHIPGRELAKAVIVKLDGTLAMAVLPASMHVDLKRLASVAHGTEATLAAENELSDRFPDCELGAIPPFGALYGMATYVDDALAKDEEIAFCAGTHHEVIKMSYADFERLEGTTAGRFSASAVAAGV
jgi:Ala-tRNA(Pro) deacylase